MLFSLPGYFPSVLYGNLHPALSRPRSRNFCYLGNLDTLPKFPPLLCRISPFFIFSFFIPVYYFDLYSLDSFCVCRLWAWYIRFPFSFSLIFFPSWLPVSRDNIYIPCVCFIRSMLFFLINSDFSFQEWISTLLARDDFEVFTLLFFLVSTCPILSEHLPLFKRISFAFNALIIISLFLSLISGFQFCDSSASIIFLFVWFASGSPSPLLSAPAFLFPVLLDVSHYFRWLCSVGILAVLSLSFFSCSPISLLLFPLSSLNSCFRNCGYPSRNFFFFAFSLRFGGFIGIRLLFSRAFFFFQMPSRFRLPLFPLFSFLLVGRAFRLYSVALELFVLFYYMYICL